MPPVDLISSNPHLLLLLVSSPDAGLPESSSFPALSGFFSQGRYNWTFQPILTDYPALFRQLVGHLLPLLHSYSLENTR
jgi:hypothetical protein